MVPFMPSEVKLEFVAELIAHFLCFQPAQTTQNSFSSIQGVGLVGLPISHELNLNQPLYLRL